MVIFQKASSVSKFNIGVCLLAVQRIEFLTQNYNPGLIALLVLCNVRQAIHTIWGFGVLKDDYTLGWRL